MTATIAQSGRAQRSLLAAVAALLVMFTVLFALPSAAWATSNGLSVVGGTENTDWSYDSTKDVLTVKSNKQLVIKNADATNATTTSIYIPYNVKANLIFAGVNIQLPANNNNCPVTLEPHKTGSGASATYDGASLHLVLADDTTNSLLTKNPEAAALRAGKSTTLVIDDAVLNEDSSGNILTPSGGKVPSTTTVKTLTVDSTTGAVTEGTKDVTAGTALGNFDSAKPGSLSCTSERHGAAIGGEAWEDGGTITINGGKITAQHKKANGGDLSLNTENSANNATAAGIGGGAVGDGGTITINGGEIAATGGYHSAGIGGGCHHTGNEWAGSARSGSAAPLDKATQNNQRGYSGNITINGGFSTSTAGNHSCAFGDGCLGGTADGKGNNSTRRNYTVKVTGGTVLAYGADTHSGTYYSRDLGCLGGKVIVTGGSLMADSFISRSADNKPVMAAYNGEGSDAEQVYLCYISLAYSTNPGKLARITDFKMYVDGKAVDYGMPFCTDDTNKVATQLDATTGDPVKSTMEENINTLYVWLPASAMGKDATTGVGHKVEVDLTAVEKDGGKEIATETFEIDGNNTAQTGTTGIKQFDHLKQWVDFSSDLKTPLDNIQASTLTKTYDGKGFAQTAADSVANFASGVTLSNPSGGKLSDKNQIKTNSHKLKVDTNGTYTFGTGANNTYSLDYGTTESPITDTALTNQVNVGKYLLAAESTQYGGTTTNDFDKSFWGHRARYAAAVINPAQTRTFVDIQKSDGGFSFPITVKPPVDENSDAYAAPGGKVELYINDKLVTIEGTSRFDLTKSSENTGSPASGESLEDGHRYSTATVNLTTEQLKTLLGDNADLSNIVVQAKYVGGDENYLESQTDKKVILGGAANLKVSKTLTGVRARATRAMSSLSSRPPLRPRG